MNNSPLFAASVILIIIGLAGLYIISWFNKRNSGGTMLGYSAETFRRPAIILIIAGLFLGFLNLLFNY